MKNKSLSIVISCYNEEANLRHGILKKLFTFLSHQKFTWEVVICDDGSTDQSLPLLRQSTKKLPNFRVFALPHGGKAAGIWGGIQKARFPYVLFTDMDQSTPIGEILHLLPYFDQGYDIVIGSRGRSRKGNSLLRKIGGNVFATLRNLLLRTHIVDTQCGFKAMKTNLAKIIFPRLAVIKNAQTQTGWRVTAYDVELLFIAQKMGYQIKEVTVAWRHQDLSTTKGGSEAARYLKESKIMTQEVIRVFLNNLKGAYES